MTYITLPDCFGKPTHLIVSQIAAVSETDPDNIPGPAGLSDDPPPFTTVTFSGGGRVYVQAQPDEVLALMEA